MSNLISCPLWKGGSTYPTGGDYYEIESRRAGGRYRITRSAYDDLSRNSEPGLSAKLTTWIVNQHRFGEAIPRITTNVLSDVRSARRLRLSEQIERFFLLAASRDFRPSDTFKISGNVDQTYKNDMDDLCAWLELESGHISGFMQLLEDAGYAKHQSNFVRLTANGFQRLEQAQSRSSQSRQAFVAMWFDPSMSEPFDKGFAKAIEAAGYSPMRIDQKEHNNKVDDEIVAEIRRSRFVVADFTCGIVSNEGKTHAIARGGVYFEAGFAMGLGIPVIWCCREDLIDSVHFDTRQFAHVRWHGSDDLKRSLYNRIAAVIGEVPGASGLV